MSRYHENLDYLITDVDISKAELEEIISEADKIISDTNSENEKSKLIEAYLKKVQCLQKLDKYSESKEPLDKLFDLDSNMPEAFVRLGIIYYKNKEYGKAIEKCNKAIEIKPDYAMAYNVRGVAKDNLKDYHEAISDYDKAIEIKPNYAHAYNNRGLIHEKEDLNQAIADYDKAIEINPKYETANKNRMKALHARLIRVRNNNAEYMHMLKRSIKTVVPFLGAGSSIPYGYDSWKELLLKLLDTCCRVQEEVSADDREKIEKHINSGHYVQAAGEMDKIFANLSSTACNAISRIAQRNPISKVNKRVLGEYIHLFPTQTYLTTNYDQVVENLLKLQFKNVNRVIATKPSSEVSGLRLSSASPSGSPTVYYLHGISTERSVILSDAHYDDHYGAEGDIKSSLRRDLPKKLRKLHNDYTFLYIGCSMTIKEDRILKLLREFYRGLGDFPYSYAFLNVVTVTGEEIAISEWDLLNAEKRKEIETKLDEKEDELENMNVRVIWYHATTVDEHEIAQKVLFEYLLGDERQKWEDKQEHERLKNIKTAEEVKKAELQQKEWEQAFENMPHEEGDNIQENQSLLVRDFLRSKILTRANTPEKYEIAFPMYKTEGGLYQISLVSENGEFYLSDNGATYAELDKIFELSEPDVIRNLDAILEQYNCGKQQGTNAFVVKCTLEDVHIKMSYLIQAISFMLNMKIFYT